MPYRLQTLFSHLIVKKQAYYQDPRLKFRCLNLSRVTSRNPEGLVSEGMLSLKDGTGFMFKYTSKKINKKSVKLYHLMLARGQQVPLKGGFYLERVKSADGKMLTQVFDASGRAQLDEADYELEDGQYRVGFAASAMETMARANIR